MIRVLHVVTLMTAGGIETLLMNLYRKIDKTKVQFDFLVQKDEKGYYDDEIISYGGRIFKVPHLNLLNYKKYEDAIYHVLMEHKDIQVVHSHNNLLSCFVMRAAHKANVDVRISHAHIGRPQLTELKQLVRYMIRPYALSLFKKYTTHRFACSDLAGNWLYGKKMSYVFFPNAVDLEKFRFDKVKREEIRDAMSIGDIKIYGHVGRLTAQKNHKKLLYIFNEIVKKDRNSRLWIIGEGELRNQLELLTQKLGIADKVEFLGVKSKVEDYYLAMDAFIFPSKYEGLPVTVVETQASGLYSVVSDKVTKQILISDMIEMHPITDSDKMWAENCINAAKKERKDCYESVKNSGFEIGTAAMRLMDFYIDTLRNN